MSQPPRKNGPRLDVSPLGARASRPYPELALLIPPRSHPTVRHTHQEGLPARRRRVKCSRAPSRCYLRQHPDVKDNV
jgi:hypothetical protein